MVSLRAALDCGVNFIDTAAAYGRGHSEELIGQLQSQVSQPFFVATKIPPKNWIWPPAPGSDIQKIFPRDWIRQNTEQSLRRLKRETLDLQQLHVWDSSWFNQSDWLEELVQLKQEGKIRSIGISLNDHQPHSAIKIVSSGAVDSVQVVYNIFDQSPEDELFSVCQKHGVGIIVRVPLDEGSLTGKFTLQTQFPDGDFRQWYFGPKILPEVLERVDNIRQTFGVQVPSLVHGALKFCLSRCEVSTVICGMRTVDQVYQNTAVSDSAPLPKTLLQSLKKHRWIRS